MNMFAFYAFLGGLVAGTLGLMRYFNWISEKSTRVRDVVSRVCIQLRPDQMANYPNDDLKHIEHIVRIDVTKICGVAALDDVRDQEFITWMDEVSPSLFPASTIWVIITSFCIAALSVPLLVLAGASTPPFSTMLDASIKGGAGTLPLFLAGAGLAGVLMSLAWVLTFWRTIVEKRLARVVLFVEQQALWTQSRERSVTGRKIVLAKDDPAFVALAKH